MEGGIEAGDLRQIRAGGGDRADRREVVRLVQGRKRRQPIERGEKPGVTRSGRLMIARRHARPDGRRRRASRPPRWVSTQPITASSKAWKSGVGVGPAPFRQHFARRVPGDEVRRRADALDLAARDERQPVAVGHLEQRELDARRARIERQDRVGHGSGRPPRLRRGLRLWAISTATAQEAIRVRSRIGAAGQDDRHARAEHDAGGVGAGEEGELLGQHVAGLEIGHDQDVGLSRDLRDDPLLGRGRRADRVVEGQRPVEQAAGDLSAIGHLAQRRGIERRAQLRD